MQKNEPAASPRTAANETIAATGQSSSPVAPRNTVTPRPNWSVLDRFRNTRILDGGLPESRATSPHARCTDGSKAEAEGTVISPARNKPKKHAEAAAHSSDVRVSRNMPVFFYSGHISTLLQRICIKLSTEIFERLGYIYIY